MGLQPIEPILTYGIYTCTRVFVSQGSTTFMKKTKTKLGSTKFIKKNLTNSFSFSLPRVRHPPPPQSVIPRVYYESLIKARAKDKTYI